MTPDAIDPTMLVHRCAGGDPDAWRILYGRYHAIVGAFLRKLGVPDGDREDACQEVFLQTFRYLPAFRGDAQLSTWLYRLCATEARKLRQRRRRSDTARATLERARSITVTMSGAAMSERWAGQRVAAALAALPQGERLVFDLFEVQGLAGNQVAKIAGCPVATVWRRLHDARQTFRAALEEEWN